MKSFTFQIFEVVCPLGEKLNFLVPWDFKFNDILITRPPKSSFTQSGLKNDMLTKKYDTWSSNSSDLKIWCNDF